MAKGYLQSGPYIPQRDAEFRDWLNNFSTLISGDPARFGFSSSDADVIAGHNAAYEAAYVPVQSAETRTPSLVQQKDAVKAAARAACQVYAMICKHNAGVTNQDKSALGIHINDTTPTPIPAPDSSPLLSIVAAFSGEHVIRYADENTPASRKKPAGALHIQINKIVAPGPVLLPDDSKMVGLFGDQPVKVEQNQEDVGLTATYFGRWVTRRGLFGPWGLPVCMTIAFGGPVEQQMWIPDGGQKQQLEGGEDDLKIAA